MAHKIISSLAAQYLIFRYILNGIIAGTGLVEITDILLW